MKYLVDAERPVFLHFLNREAADAAAQNRDVLRDLLAINLMLLCHCSGMTVNISQMIEYSGDSVELQAALLKLATSRILITTSREPNISDFISSRQTLYRNVSSRYPMYFDDASPLEGFEIAHANSFSMTRLLKRNIFEHSNTQLTLIGKRARDEDLNAFSLNIDALQEIAFKQEDEAITKANFARLSVGTSLSQKGLDSVGRVFSALYFEHYAQRSFAATCTGLIGAGYLDDLTFFPHYDVPILKSAMHALDWASVRANSPNLDDEIIGRYGGAEHRHFVETLHAFVNASFVALKMRSNNFRLDHESEPAVRAQLVNLISAALRGVDRRHLPQNLMSFYVIGAETIATAASREALINSHFKMAWEENMPPKQKVRLLLLTATDTEDDAVDDALKTAGFRSSGAVKIGEGYGELYRRGSNKEIVRVRSSAGSTGSSGSELVTSDAIVNSGATMVISAGICFGLRRDKHTICDVLVSDMVADYETVRLSPAETLERGTRQPAGSKLLSAVRIARRQQDTPDFDVHTGLVLSGQKLVDSEEFRDELRKRFPDAIGGEMEGVGISAAAARAKVEWIVIKAICDWGVGKKKKDQPRAAANAASFAVKVIELVLDAETNRLLV